MQLALAFHAGDADQAQRWLDWNSQLGGTENHSLFLMAARGAPAVTPDKSKWKEVATVEDGYGIQSNWNANAPIRDASGPNSMIRQFAWHFYIRAKGPWMFIEPDCIPLRSTWLDELEAEYTKAGKPFMGAVIPGKTGEYDTHMTGNMILPQHAATVKGLMMSQTAKYGNDTIEIAFDVAAAKDIVPVSHDTSLIHQIFRGEPFNTAEDLVRIRQGAALFHTSKDGSLIERLREKRSGAVVVSPTLPAAAPAEKPKVYAYDGPSSDPDERMEQVNIISIWKRAWQAIGYDPVLITQEDAAKHPDFAMLFARFSALPTINPKGYEMACWLRWVAMAQIGGLMVDYDVVAQGHFVRPDPPPFGGPKILCVNNLVPCAVIGTKDQYSWAASQFLNSAKPVLEGKKKHLSDMHAVQKIGFPGQDVVREYGKPGWKTAALIHYGHYACHPRKRSVVMMEPIEAVPPDPPVLIEAHPPTVKELIDALVEHSKKDGFAKGRIVVQLRKAGLIPAKTK